MLQQSELSRKLSDNSPREERTSLLSDEDDQKKGHPAAQDNGRVPLSLHTRTVVFMAFWFFCSGCTLFGNKHIMTTLHADPSLLAMCQMSITALFGAAKMYGPWLLGLGPGAATPLSTQSRRNFVTDMAVVGLMRVTTVLLGLVSLKYVAVSFTETIKASAPFFTVIFARMMLNEHTSPQVQLTLMPVVGGLMVCSATELSFTTIGFVAAVLNNCIDCVQNVFSKRLLSTHYNYVNLQFYTSAAALVLQLPLTLYNESSALERHPMTTELAIALFINGTFFHLQSVTAYAVMGLISPVSQSVANTLKRAMLIWASILYFGNPVTWVNACGTMMCIGGVLGYNHMRRRYPYKAPTVDPGSRPPDSAV